MGIAKTEIEYEDYLGNDWIFYIWITTDRPDKDIHLFWKEKTDNVNRLYKPVEQAKRAFIDSGILTVINNLRRRINRLKNNDPTFCYYMISDDLLINALNTLSQWEGKKLIWTDKDYTKPEDPFAGCEVNTDPFFAVD